MNGMTIFNHSVRQITGNLGMAIKISGWFVMLVILMLLVGYWLIPPELLGMITSPPEEMMTQLPVPLGEATTFMLLLAVAAVALSWGGALIAIVWHRYILLEEIPRGTIPYNPNYRIGKYFWSGVGIWLLITLAVILLGGLLIGILSLLTGGGVLAVLTSALVTGVLITALYLRMALILPAIALQENLTIGQAWEQSAGSFGAIAVLALMLTILSIVADFIIEFLAGVGLPVLIISALQLGFAWFYFMLNISVLSTLYGYLVQKREVY
ncbi:MAG: hypothetical protein L3J37_02230 [Rhodobacteraceae bacterium]|nr:hypothetical protein [Paracoccaceae bacterium]